MTQVNPYQAPRANVADAEEEFQAVNIWSGAGRIGRARYIAWTMGSVLIFYLAFGLLAAILIPLGRDGTGALLLPILMIIGGIALFVLQILLTIQRCHDFDVNGWLTLIIIVPLAFFVFWFVPGTNGNNRWGAQPVPNSGGVLVAAWLGALIIPVIGILAAIAVPAYQDYAKRAKAMQMQQQR
jgi:uncharacterized membrane protein YhaH (DUF805 family)